MDSVIPFRKLTPDRHQQAGGKGGTLALLFQKKYPVPEGFIVMPEAFEEDDLLPEAWQEVLFLLDTFRKSDPEISFSVRSSAVAEDSALASFAGEFETILNVQSDEEIKSAINIVRQSRNSERVRTYSQAQDVETIHEMAVVVQRLIQAEISGVLFTADPITGGRNRMTGNYAYGLGDKLVSGETGAAEFTIQRYKHQYEGPTELEQYHRRLCKLAEHLEKDLGCPQDIEWAISENKVYILQSRPVTTMTGYNPATGEFNDSLTGDYAWSCVNLVEAVSEVMTPFTWSIFRNCFRQFDFFSYWPTLGNIGGRPYLNVSVSVFLYRIVSRMGKSFRTNLVNYFNEIAGLSEEYLEEIGRSLTPPPGVSLRSMISSGFSYSIKQVKGFFYQNTFIAGNIEWCSSMYRQLRDTQSSTALSSLWVREIEPYFLRAFSQLITTTQKYGFIAGKLRLQLIELAGTADTYTLMTHYKGEGDLLESLGPVVGLSRVSRGEMSREEYLEKWGHRCASESELSVPRPFEDHGWLDRELATFDESPVDVDLLLSERHSEYKAALERLSTRYPHRMKSLEKQMGKCVEAGHARESVRSEIMRVFWVARNWVLHAGEITGIGEDAFFLTTEELLELLSGDDSSVNYIPKRKQTHLRYKGLPPYPVYIHGRFDPFRWAEDPERRSDFYDSHSRTKESAVSNNEENTIIGVPGAAGQIEGMVRRLDNPEDGDKLKKGEILVTSRTNIAWTLLFPRAGAIITDIGATLSHAAIVARELGIPAVVNCGDATMRLRTGDRVRVDGAQGTVEILDN